MSIIPEVLTHESPNPYRNLKTMARAMKVDLNKLIFKVFIYFEVSGI
jgi:hypothetical protein